MIFFTLLMVFYFFLPSFFVFSLFLWTRRSSKEVTLSREKKKVLEDIKTHLNVHVKVHFASAKLNALYATALFKVCVCVCVCVEASQREEHFAVIR